jgi:hypothetical protein
METFKFWLIAVFYSDGCTLHQFAEQSEALKRYLKQPQMTILYELTVGEKMALREVMRKNAEAEE